MKWNAFIPSLILLLVVVASSVGALSGTPGSPQEFKTVRGELAIYQGSGLYRYDPVALAREGKVWDVINLFLGTPLFAAALVLSQRNALRGRLLLSGLLFYFFYAYLMYAVMVAFNPLFLVYVAIFALCPVAFVLNLQNIEISRLPSQVSARFPRRLFVGFTYFLSGALLLLWLGRIVPMMVTGHFPAELAGMTTLETQALDLGMVVPLALSAGIMLQRDSAWGYLLTGVVLTFGALMCITIPAWIAVPLIEEGKINLFEACPFLLICLTGLFLAGRFYSSVQES